MTVDLKVDLEKIKMQLNEKTKKAQELLDHMVLNDSDKYAPHVTGNLRKKGLDTVLGSGFVIWNVSYAKKVYHELKTEPSLAKNPNARRKWFEVAKSEKLKVWEANVNEVFAK
jgi:hypothetical protein